MKQQDFLSRDELRGEGCGFVGQCGAEDEVAIPQRLLRLLHESLGLIVLGLRVRVELSVIDASEIACSAGERIARLPLGGGIRSR